jgi:hypothetical protein
MRIGDFTESRATEDSASEISGKIAQIPIEEVLCMIENVCLTSDSVM